MTILGAIQQGGRFIWAVDTPLFPELRELIELKIVTFKDQTGILAHYIPLVDSCHVRRTA